MSAQTTYGDTMTAAIAGQLADNGEHDVMPMYNEEASAEIAFGRAVKFGTNANGALLPTAETDVIAGIVMHTHAYTRGWDDADLGDTGVKPDAALSVLRKGRIWVTVEDDVVANVSRLWVRAVAGGDPEFLGGLLDADDGTDTVDCTNQGVFRTTASAGGLAILEVDFVNRPT
jgi:hypothetical protein